jgi:hypothetical protein
MDEVVESLEIASGRRYWTIEAKRRIVEHMVPVNLCNLSTVPILLEFRFS